MGIFVDTKASTMYNKCAFHWRVVQRQYEDFAKSEGLDSSDINRAIEIAKCCKTLDELFNKANKGLKPKPDLDAISEAMGNAGRLYAELNSYPEKRYRLLEMFEFTPRVLSRDYGSLWLNSEGYNHYWFSD